MTAKKKTTEEQPEEKMKVKILTAADILQADDIRTVDVLTPEWGGAVRIRSLTANEAIEFARSQTNKKENTSAIDIVVLSAIDEDGEKLFTHEQIDALRKKSFRPIIQIQEKALEINGMSIKAHEKAKNDSSEVASEDSPTASQ